MTPQRFNTKEQADFEIYGKNGQFTAVLKNISATGAYLEIIDSAGNTPAAGELLHVRVHLDQLKKVRDFDAEVKWNNETGLGVKFMNKGDVLKRMFNRFIVV
ncbi:MAG: PilZ domain-containing protein [Bdellovibrionota bacterium]